VLEYNPCWQSFQVVIHWYLRLLKVSTEVLSCKISKTRVIFIFNDNFNSLFCFSTDFVKYQNIQLIMNLCNCYH